MRDPLFFLRLTLRRRARAGLPLLAVLALLAAGCSSESAGGPSGGGTRSAPASATGGGAAPAKGSVKVERTVATGLKSPWGLAALKGGDLLVSSRDTGRILRVDGKSGKKTELGTVPGVAHAGEGGLLGIAVPPGDERMIYAYLTTDSDNRIVRMLYDGRKKPGDRLAAPDTILKGIPKGPVHNGGRIAFGPDGMLYAGTGESGHRRLSQDHASLAGKILRMTPDGDPPAKGNPARRSVVYSYGHRNVQGLAWDAGHRLWASEFGQDTWDELNLIRPGRNYGWPDAEGKPGKGGTAGHGRFTGPVAEWRTDEASPSGVAVVGGAVWMAALRGERLWRIPLRGDRPAATPQSFLTGRYGRLRTVAPAGGDGLWLMTSETDGRGSPGKGDDRLLRLTVT